MPQVLKKQKITSATVTKTRPADNPFLIWDTLQHGFALQIQPSGHRAYKVIYRYHNRPRWFHIGAADAIALDAARELAAELMLRVIKGEDPQAEKQAKRGSGTFAELADRYLEEHAKKRNKSWQQTDRLMRRHLLPAWGGLIVQSITRSDVRALMGKIDKPVLANQVVKSASAIFSWAMRQDLLVHNPCRGVEHNPTTSRERVLTNAEVPQFWQSFSKAGVAGAALQVLLLTGQRPGEVKLMQHNQIVDGWWTLPGLPNAATGWRGTKNGATHKVWLPQPVQEIITELRCGDPFVFGQSLNLDAAMRSVCAQLKAPRAVPTICGEHTAPRSPGWDLVAMQ
jgi:hypothetical protein